MKKEPTLIQSKYISSASFGMAIICFFLPFMNVKCNEKNLATISGIELVTGSKLNIQQNADQSNELNSTESHEETEIQDQTINRNYFAVAAWVLAISGLVLSFLFFLQKEMILSAVGLGGALSLMLMRIQLDSSLEKQSGGISNYLLHIDYVFGYWLAIVCFLAGGLSNMLQHIDALRNDLEKGT
ncbi:MAG: hypothetical protein IPO83_05535 [Chitinophagaceae bacterium]|nr:hypothetical protein [Chitinophagaceae bacterium]